jgi:predicted O-methyltransferase YrrM
MSVADHDQKLPATLAFDADVQFGIKRREAEIMFQLLRRERPEATAEIGCANGASTLVIASALESNGRGHHHAVDPMQVTAWKEAGKGRVADANLSHRVTFHDVYPEEAFPTLPQLDFVFIDGSHLFDLTILDFVLADKRLREGGIIAFHDTCLPAIRKVLHFVLANRAYEALRLTSRPLTRRWSIMKTVRLKAAAVLAHVISGEAEIIPQSVSFKQLGLDRLNLVYIRKLRDDYRHNRYFSGF